MHLLSRLAFRSLLPLLHRVLICSSIKLKVIHSTMFTINQSIVIDVVTFFAMNFIAFHISLYIFCVFCTLRTSPADQQFNFNKGFSCFRGNVDMCILLFFFLLSIAHFMIIDVVQSALNFGINQTAMKIMELSTVRQFYEASFISIKQNLRHFNLLPATNC